MSDHETIAGILATGREIWGPPAMSLPHVALCAGVVAGDLARQARARVEGRTIVLDSVATELGNLVVSAVRWADDLGLDPAVCIERAFDAQRTYVAATR